MRAENEIEAGPARFHTVGPLGELAGALVKAQSEFTAVPKTKTAKVPLKSGGSYSYHYADLADIWDMIRQPLAKAGIAVFQPVDTDAKPGFVVVTTLLVHAGSGQSMSCDVTMPTSQAGAQGLGSAITYARRYGLGSMLGIVTDEDEDASLAQGENDRHGVGQTESRGPRYVEPTPNQPPPAATPKAQGKKNQTARGAELAAKMKPLEGGAGTFKGKAISAMTGKELGEAIREAEGKLLIEPNAAWAAQVREKISLMELELRRRDDEAAEAALAK